MQAGMCHCYTPCASLLHKHRGRYRDGQAAGCAKIVPLPSSSSPLPTARGRRHAVLCVSPSGVYQHCVWLLLMHIMMHQQCKL